MSDGQMQDGHSSPSHGQYLGYECPGYRNRSDNGDNASLEYRSEKNANTPVGRDSDEDVCERWRRSSALLD